MKKAKPTQEMACGNCGWHLFKIRSNQSSEGAPVTDVALVCDKCGSVSHLVPSAPTIEIEWGRPSEGESDKGLLCGLPWPTETDNVEPF